MSFEITILGTSSATPAYNRFLTAHVLNVHEHLFLIDCGEATQMQLRRYGININKINHIFISHLHADHYLGIFGLLASAALMGREHDLHLFAPPELKPILDFQMKYLADLQFNIVFHETSAKESYLLFENKHITVQTIPLNHRIPTTGFLFRETPKARNITKEAIELYKIPIAQIHGIKMGNDFVTESGELIANHLMTLAPFEQRSYAFCSDTAFYSDKIAPIIQGADILYHEATFANDKKEEAIRKRHSTAEEAAQTAKDANVKQLIIGHFSSRYKHLNTLLDEAQAIFPNTVLAQEGARYSVAMQRKEE